MEYKLFPVDPINLQVLVFQLNHSLLCAVDNIFTLIIGQVCKLLKLI